MLATAERFQKAREKGPQKNIEIHHETNLGKCGPGREELGGVQWSGKMKNVER